MNVYEAFAIRDENSYGNPCPEFRESLGVFSTFEIAKVELAKTAFLFFESMCDTATVYSLLLHIKNWEDDEAEHVDYMFERYGITRIPIIK